MPNTKRVSLTFDLDNGDERQVYELLQNKRLGSAPFSKKR